MAESEIPAGYEIAQRAIGHPRDLAGVQPTVPTTSIVAVAASWFVATLVAVAVAVPSPLVALVGVAIALVVGGRRCTVGFVLVVIVLPGLAAVRSTSAQAALQPDQLGPFDGWATVVREPRRAGGVTRAVLEIDGERYEAWVRGPVRQLRTRTWRGGDQVRVSGDRDELSPSRRPRVASQHIVGEFVPEWLGDSRPGARLGETSNRVRAVIERGAAALPDDQAALTRGLVMGDDRDQPDEMIQRFRDSGLAHLTAVSGQNVSLVLAAAGPLLQRIRPGPRWAVSLALIAWFVLLTRAEPSILRAGAMGMLGVTAIALGRPREPARLLGIAVTGLLLIDPLLAWSVGFWLSVGATAGVTVIGPWLQPRLRRLGPLAPAVAVTLGAQIGVATPSLLVFGHLSLIGVVANLVAVPVAGIVMLVGLPACLVAGMVPPLAVPVMMPVGWAVRWVDAVAMVGAVLEPQPPWSWLGWVALLVVLGWLARRPRARSTATSRADRRHDGARHDGPSAHR